MGRIIRNPFAMALVGILLGLCGGVVLGVLVLLLLNSKPAEMRPAPSLSTSTLRLSLKRITSTGSW